MIAEELKYPIGQHQLPEQITKKDLQEWISIIENFSCRIREEVEHLSDEQLDTPYRPGGWTVRQLVNHCADSHMNSLIRFKLALTEDVPVIKPYLEHLWAELADSKNMLIAPALSMLEGIHARWTVLLRSLSNEDLQRSFLHPAHSKALRLDECISLYAWHCSHHLAHITSLKLSRGWA